MNNPPKSSPESPAKEQPPKMRLIKQETFQELMRMWRKAEPYPEDTVGSEGNAVAAWSEPYPHPAKEQPGNVAELVRLLKTRADGDLQHPAELLCRNAAAMIEKLGQEPSRYVVNWTTEGCPKHHGQPWTMTARVLYTEIGKRCPLCEPPPPERP